MNRTMNCVRLLKLIPICLAFAILAAANCGPANAQQWFAPAAPALNADAQKAMQQQLHKVFDPMLQAELSFANRVARPKDEERRKLIAASVAWLEEFIGEFVKKQDQNQQQFLLQGLQQVVIRGQRDTLDPRESIQQGVAKLVAETLTADQAAAYEAEVAQRTKFYRDVVVSNLVAQLDEKLALAPEQREKISRSLLNKWDDKWPPQIESFAYTSHYFLPAPQDAVGPALTKPQRQVFERLNDSSQHITFFNGMGDENEVIDDVDLEEQAPAENGPPIVAHPVADQAQNSTN